MNARRINSTLYGTAMACALGGVASLLVGFALPLEKQEIASAGQSGPATTKSTTPAGLPSLADFEHVWTIPLRQNLGSTPPPQATVATAPMPQPIPAGAGLPVSLVGTIGTSLAMLRTSSNSVEVRGVGESLNGVEVIAVRTAEVDVRYNGQVVTLAKPPEPQPR